LDWEDCNIYKLASLFLNSDEKQELQVRYQSGKEGYGHFKKYLKELIWDEFEMAREKKAYYETHIDEVHDILKQGALKVGQIADKKMAKVREVVGL